LRICLRICVFCLQPAYVTSRGQHISISAQLPTSGVTPSKLTQSLISWRAVMFSRCSVDVLFSLLRAIAVSSTCGPQEIEQ
jgi:hypothetical protein